MAFLTSIWTWLTGSILVALAFIRSLCFARLRLKRQTAAFLYDAIAAGGKFFVLEEELAGDRLPHVFVAFGFINWMPAWFAITERKLEAGMAGVDMVATVSEEDGKVSDGATEG